VYHSKNILSIGEKCAIVRPTMAMPEAEIKATLEALHRILTSRPHHAHYPSLEDVFTLTDPDDFKTSDTLREKIESLP
jgi:hypothetical protein